jgi:hypothetical protein
MARGAISDPRAAAVAANWRVFNSKGTGAFSIPKLNPKQRFEGWKVLGARRRLGNDAHRQSTRRHSTDPVVLGRRAWRRGPWGRSVRPVDPSQSARQGSNPGPCAAPGQAAGRAARPSRTVEPGLAPRRLRLKAARCLPPHPAPHPPPTQPPTSPIPLPFQPPPHPSPARPPSHRPPQQSS